MEMKESELEKVLGGANRAVIPELNGDVTELSEKDLEKALDGAPKEVVVDAVLNNPQLYRPRSYNEIKIEQERSLNGQRKR